MPIYVKDGINVIKHMNVDNLSVKKDLYVLQYQSLHLQLRFSQSHFNTFIYHLKILISREHIKCSETLKIEQLKFVVILKLILTNIVGSDDVVPFFIEPTLSDHRHKMLTVKKNCLLREIMISLTVLEEHLIRIVLLI